MRLSVLILLFLISTNGFSQTRDVFSLSAFEKNEIIKNKFIELINAYNENSDVIKYEPFEKIINLLEYVFIENYDSIIEYNQIKMIFSENNILFETDKRFIPMHLTGSFTYCTGKILVDNISYEFYLYEYNKYSWDYNEIKNNNNLSFCYFDTNDNAYGYFNIFTPNEHAIFEINKYKNIESFLEIPVSKIFTKIIYNYKQ
ncbi:MAG: hypothetical protein LBV17_03035 [Treponema sp.]|jgi:hypothetical protein|nr:hypothetical protein [Treponema sp.]